MTNAGERVVFFSAPHSPHGSAMRGNMSRACERVEAALKLKVRLWDTEAGPFTQAHQLFAAIREADVVVVDLTELRPNVMVELGVRIGSGKPFVLISNSTDSIPFDLAQLYRFIYDPYMAGRAIVAQLADRIEELLRFPDQWEVPWHAPGPKTSSRRISSVFVSYSRLDNEYLTRLRVHLRPLEKSNLIELWDDSRIKSGERWKEVIEAALTRAAVAVLLVSADFLASDFIVDNELPPLLRAAEEKGTAILPVIIKPSRFLRDPNLAAFQAVNDPAYPLIALPGAEREAVYARLAERIEALVDSRSP